MTLRHRLAGFLTALLLLLALPLAAQDSEPSEAEAVLAEPGAHSAPVVVEGDVLFVVRGSSALPAVERAEKVQSRILRVADRSQAKAVTVAILDNEYGREIKIDGTMVTITSEADAEYENMALELLAGQQAEAIKQAILQYRQNRSKSARVESVFAAVGWSIGFLILSLLFFARRKAMVAMVGRFAEKRIADVEAATKRVVRGKAISAVLQYAVNMLLWIGYLFLFYYYLSFVLLAFAETRPLAELLLTYVSEPLADLAWGFITYLPNLFTLIIIALVTRFFIQGVRLFFDNLEKGVFEVRDFERHWIAPTYMLVRLLIILIAVVFAIPYIPASESRAFQGLTILAGVMLSLGSNAVVSNMMAGLFVIYRRSTNIGDRIKVGDKTGDVVEIKLMETLIKSVKNELISIPNSQLLNSEVVNYTRQIDGRGLLVHTTVGIGYEEPPAKIEAMLKEAADRTADLNKSPAPFVLWTQLADYAINYEINAYSTRGNNLPAILSELHRNIVEVFNENGTQIMTPSYIADPEVPKVPDGVWVGKLAGPMKPVGKVTEKE